MKKAIYSSILGLLIIALGIFMWANPNAFVNILAFIFALYMLFDGFKALISSHLNNSFLLEWEFHLVVLK